MKEPGAGPADEQSQQKIAHDVKEKAFALNLAIRMATVNGLRVDVEVGRSYTDQHLKLDFPTPAVKVTVSRPL